MSKQFGRSLAPVRFRQFFRGYFAYDHLWLHLPLFIYLIQWTQSVVLSDLLYLLRKLIKGLKSFIKLNMTDTFVPRVLDNLDVFDRR